MKLQAKLVLGASLLSVIALIVASVAISVSVSRGSSIIFTNEVEKELTASNHTSKVRIEQYLEQISFQLKSLSNDPKTVSNTKVLKRYFATFAQTAKLPAPEEQRAALKDYYEKEFGKTYFDINNTSIDIDQLLQPLDENTLALQYQYIAANPNPLGSKDALDTVDDNSLYSKIHDRIHPQTREFLNSFGFYDIFIADVETGNIVYSVFKEIDFATSLLTGPYADTGLGEAFKLAQQATSPNDTFLTDFDSYTPSYGAGASFMSSPVFSGSTMVGVMIFQMPVDGINGILTQNGQWEKTGLGKTGESVLVGSDKRIRSTSRGLIEDKTGFIELLKNRELVDQQTLRRIDSLGNNLLLQTIDNPAVEKALAGEAGSTQYIKYTGNKVISSFEPVDAFGLNWAIVTEMDYDEAVEAVQTLVATIIKTTVITIVVVMILAIFAAFIFSQSITRPIKNVNLLFRDLAEGDGDLTARLDAKGRDEIGEMALSFNRFVEKIQSILLGIEQEIERLTSSAQIMSTSSSENKSGAETQRKSTSALALSMQEMNLAADEVANSAIEAEKAANVASDTTHTGVNTVEATTESVQSVASKVEQAVTIMNELEATSENIGSVVGVISGIAEQTNLLALNAAIEAARAGEQGRGFAVVADEVRALASRTQESTHEINTIVEKLQQNANSAVNVMRGGHEAVESCVNEALNAKEALAEIQTQIQSISDMNLRISASAEEQNAVGKSMQGNVQDIESIATSNADRANTVMEKNQEVIASVDVLNRSVSQFKLR